MRLSTPWRHGAASLALLTLLFAAARPAGAQAYTSAPIAAPPAYDDISDAVGLTGGVLLPGAVRDDPGLTLPIAFADVAPTFSFPFYGVNRASFRVSSEGYLSFNPQMTPTATNPTSVSTTQPNDWIAGFWDNLDFDIGTPFTQVHYLNDPLNNRFIIQWKNAHVTSTTNYNFQIHLYTNGNVELHYGTMTSPSSASYTAGVENATGTTATFVFANPTVHVVSNTAYRLTRSGVPLPPVPSCFTINTPSSTAGARNLNWSMTTTNGTNTDGFLVNIGTTGVGSSNVANNLVTPFPYVPIALLPDRTYYYSITPYNSAGSPAACNNLSSVVGASSNTVTTYPHTETFGTGLIPSSWTNDPGDAGPGVTVGATSAGEEWLSATSVATNGPTGDHTTGSTAGGFAYITDGTAGSAPFDNAPVNLVTRPFDFSMISAPRVRFWVQNGRAAVSDGVDVPVLFVDATKDGMTWTQLGTVSTQLTTWTEQTVLLTGFGGESRVFLRFRAAEVGVGVDNPLAIDDVKVDQNVTAVPNAASRTAPLDNATGVVYGAPIFTWTAPTGGEALEGYKLRVGTSSGGGEILDNFDVGNVLTYMLRARLNPSMTYYWTVVPYNSVGSASAGSPFSFSTAAPITISSTTSLLEDFSGTTFPPANWTFFDNGSGLTRSWALTGTAPNTNAFSTWEFSTPAAVDYLATPALVIPASGALLTFKMWQTSTGTSSYRVMISTTAQGAAGNYTAVGNTLASWTSASTSCPGTTAAIPGAAPTTPNCVVTVPSSYAGQTVYLAIVHETNGGREMQVDDVQVTEAAPPNCIAQSSPVDGGTAPSYNSTAFSWTPSTTGPAATSFLIDVGTSAATPTDIVSGTSVTTTSYTLTPTTPGTSYYYRVRPTNVIGSATGCAVRSFTTAAPVAVFPAVETLGVAACTLPVNWQNIAGGTESWLLSTSGGGSGAATDHTTGTGCFARESDTAPHSTDVRLVTNSYNFTALAHPRLRFWYQNALTGSVTAGSSTNIPILTVHASTDNGTTWSAALATINTKISTWTEQSVSLLAYASNPNVRLRFEVDEVGTETDNDPSLDDITVDETPTTPVFSVSPTSGEFGSVAVCSSPASAVRSFVVTNTGIGMLSVTGASITSGGPAYTITTAPAYPVDLTAGQSTTIGVTLVPAALTSGVQTGALQIAYDTGTPATANVTLTGIADPANLAAASQSGVSFRSSAAGACTSGSVVPAPGTAFVPLNTPGNLHTRFMLLGGGDLDDGFYTMDAATLDASIPGQSVRFMGRNYEQLHVGTNGYVTFASGFSVFSPSLPNVTAGALAAAVFTDLDFRTTFDSDNTGENGKPGIFYGKTDVDSDGDQELVITWWHAYDQGTTAVYPTSTARYVTAQLIIHDSGVGNIDDRFEMRYPTGNDNATPTPVPYSRNLDQSGFVAAGGVAIGLSNQEGTASSEYRDLTSGGPVPAAGGLGVMFQSETQETAEGLIGYRLMGVPVTGYTVGRLADLNLVQRVATQYPSAPGPNLYTAYVHSTGQYTAAATVTEALVPGQGFFWRLYNQSIPASAGFGGGTSASYLLPMALQGTGQEVPVSGTTYTYPQTGTLPAGFSLIANPFRAGLEINTTDIDAWERPATAGRDLASRVLQSWDPGAGTYVGAQSSPILNVASAWQGFFVENRTDANLVTSLVIPTTDRVANGVFVGRDGATTAPSILAFELSGTVAGTGLPTLDRAATLAVDSSAVDAWDPADASKLAPLLTSYATVGFQGEYYDGTPRVKSQDSRALDAASFDIPLVVDAAGTNPALTLSWAGLDVLPETWALELRDLVTGATVDLRAVASYTFDQTAAAARPDTDDLVALTTTAAQAKATDAPRFVLHVTTGRTTAVEDAAPAGFALAAPAPNPTSGAATVSFDVPEAATVRVAVYDMIGRQVAVLAQGEVAAGRHSARLEAGMLAPGVYVVRMDAGTFSSVRRVTVVR